MFIHQYYNKMYHLQLKQYLKKCILFKKDFNYYLTLLILLLFENCLSELMKVKILQNANLISLFFFD